MGEAGPLPESISRYATDKVRKKTTLNKKWQYCSYENEDKNNYPDKIGNNDEDNNRRINSKSILLRTTTENWHKQGFCLQNLHVAYDTSVGAEADTSPRQPATSYM